MIKMMTNDTRQMTQVNINDTCQATNDTHQEINYSRQEIKDTRQEIVDESCNR